MNKKETLNFLKKLAEGLAEMFGSDCETVIHDLRTEDEIIVAIYNGHVTGRKVGDKLNLLGVYELEEMENGKDFYNCLCKTQDGRLLKSTTVHFKTKDFHFAFGINFDYSKFYDVSKVLSSFMKIGVDVTKVVTEDPNEKLFDGIYSEAVKYFDKNPKVMTREEKLEFINYIKEHGGFSLKKSVVNLAKYLEVSRYTIYNYFKELGIDPKHK
ncbi:transcriptional regulator [Fusobacterium sp.]|uniref:helix-turn-helix transcriptional regulator n=1 Tax=Fusobacterium sp. TaxID=68766 RepID=UPI00262CB276|nr:helix-turn-helix transcriptional regulator [Fusobacterium sp.]